MNKVSALDRLEVIREKATKEGNYKLAIELGEIQLEIIDERSREWARGYDTGHGLALREMQVRRLKGKTKVSSINR